MWSTGARIGGPIVEGAGAARDFAGWGPCLDHLEVVVGGGTAERLAPTGSWRAYYEEYKRLGLPATAPLPE